jgi:hypothetical protein
LKSAPINASLSGPLLYARHTSLPVFRSSAITQPRTPISPPESPTMTLSFTASGAIVTVSPMSMLPTRVRHTSLPVAASTAMVWSSSVL